MKYLAEKLCNFKSIAKHFAVILISILVFSLFCLRVEAEEYKIGDIVKFGIYNPDARYGVKDIEWIVLDKREDEILLISKECLECKPYHNVQEPVTWEKSYLRKWLNREFIESAFTEEEQKRIVLVENENPKHSTYGTDSGDTTSDRIFLLSIEEAKTYFESFKSRQARVSTTAARHGAYQDKTSNMGWWWLRTASYFPDHVTFVTSGGDVSVDGRPVTRKDAGVRPAMWIREKPVQKTGVGRIAENEKRDNQQNPLPTEDRTFEFTPNDFLESFISAMKDNNKDVYYTFPMEDGYKVSVFENIEMDEAEPLAKLAFYRRDTSLISYSEFDALDIFIISIESGVGRYEDLGFLISRDVVSAFAKTMDPDISIDQLFYLYFAKMVALAEAIDPQLKDEWFWIEHDGYLYEFMHSGSEAEGTGSEEFNVYPSNWLAKKGS